MELLGLETIEVRLVKRDADLEGRIIATQGIPEEKRPVLQEMMRYNCWTINQFSDITGLALSSIANMTRPIYSKKEDKMITHLDFCYPFKDLGSPGKKFIVRNEKSEKYLP